MFFQEVCTVFAVVTYNTITALCGGVREEFWWFQQTDSAALEGTAVFHWL